MNHMYVLHFTSYAVALFSFSLLAIQPSLLVSSAKSFECFYKRRFPHIVYFGRSVRTSTLQLIFQSGNIPTGIVFCI